jgi:hypothetical protein
VPCHARKYADLAAEYARIPQIRIDAFKALVKDVGTGACPSAPWLLAAPQDEMTRFRQMMAAKQT